MAKLAIEFHPEAASDYYSALAWYRERSPNAARQFEAEFVRAVERIQASPNRWPVYMRGCRRFLLRQFPFQIVYRIGKEVSLEALQLVFSLLPVLVAFADGRLPTADSRFFLAVAHARRKPGYWKPRL